MLNLKTEKKRIDAALEAALDPVLSPRGFERHRENVWTRDLQWAQHACSIGVRKRHDGLFLEVIGGAGIFLREYHPVFQPDFMEYASSKIPPSTMGGPLHWIDERLNFDVGRFTTWEEFEQLMPLFKRAIDERVLPEFDRYESDEAVLRSLRRPNWSKEIRFSLTQDRRAALIVLMLAKYEGAAEALAWGRPELTRIKSQDETRSVRWRELQRAIDSVSSHDASAAVSRPS
jgi:hypothetical protein